MRSSSHAVTTRLALASIAAIRARSSTGRRAPSVESTYTSIIVSRSTSLPTRSSTKEDLGHVVHAVRHRLELARRLGQRYGDDGIAAHANHDAPHVGCHTVHGA